jgi:hypothetical protein
MLLLKTLKPTIPRIPLKVRRRRNSLIILFEKRGEAVASSLFLFG